MYYCSNSHTSRLSAPTNFKTALGLKNKLCVSAHCPLKDRVGRVGKKKIYAKFFSNNVLRLGKTRSYNVHKVFYCFLYELLLFE